MDFIGNILAASPLIAICGYIFFRLGKYKKSKKIEQYGKYIFVLFGAIFLGWILISIADMLINGFNV